MTPHELELLKRKFPLSAATIARNKAADTGTPAKLERHPTVEPLAKEQVQKGSSQRFLVRVTSRRRRLLDEDNLCEKYHVDLLRYAGLIPDDAPDKVKIEVGQVKVGSKEPEEVVIEIEEI